MEPIADMENFIKSRQKKGKMPREVRKDLEDRGYDFYAAQGLVMRYWEFEEENDGASGSSTGGS